MPYVYSTLSAPTVYSTVVGDILIEGGANVPDKHLLTPYGKVTAVTDEQLTALQEHHVFKIHSDNGFISVSEHKEDSEKVASDMTGRDLSAPDTAESLIAEDSDIESIEGGVIKRKAK